MAELVERQDWDNRVRCDTQALPIQGDNTASNLYPNLCPCLFRILFLGTRVEDSYNQEPAIRRNILQLVLS